MDQGIATAQNRNADSTSGHLRIPLTVKCVGGQDATARILLFSLVDVHIQYRVYLTAMCMYIKRDYEDKNEAQNLCTVLVSKVQK